jgi:hypothetical protein
LTRLTGITLAQNEQKNQAKPQNGIFVLV